MANCSKCGKPINDGEKICSNCRENVGENANENNNGIIEDISTKIVSSVKETVTNAADKGQEFIDKINSDEKVQQGKEKINEYTSKVKKNPNMIKWIAAIVVVVLIGIFLIGKCVLSPTSSPEKTVRNFIEAINDRDIEEFMDYTNFTDYLEIMGISEDVLDSYYDSPLIYSIIEEEFSDFQYVKILDIEEIYKKDKTAKVRVMTTTFDGYENYNETIDFLLIKDDGEWLIDINSFDY